MQREQFLQNYWQSYPMNKSWIASGRLIQMRHAGAEIFLVLSKNGINQEFKLKKNIVSENQELLLILRSGDIVGVGEDYKIVLLAPQISSLPNRQWNWDFLKLWPRFLVSIRQFFMDRNFIEVQTPHLVTCPGTEPSLDPFETELKLGTQGKKVFLPTSPEIHLKKAIAMGFDKVFEITPCFRNAEMTEHHQPEFYMLEWYRAYEDISTLKKDTTDLIYHLWDEFSDELLMKVPDEIQSFTVAELFRQKAQMELKTDVSIQELKQKCQELGLESHGLKDIDDYFFLIFLEKIEKHFSKENLIFVEKYPPFQSAYARLDKQGWADRFEVYWQGLELANAFQEVNDPREQERRFQRDLDKKRSNHKSAVGLDEEFLKFLQSGFPPTSGIALGVERLFMAFFGITDIKSMKAFPYLG